MKVIEVNFLKFKEWSFYEVINGENQKGVYVIWDSSAKAKPTYIGEGDVLSRITSHHIKFYRPIDGFIAFFEGSSKETKETVEIVEAALLDISQEVDRYPTQNNKAGKTNQIVKVFSNHGKIKIRVSGYDPFQPPQKSVKLSSEKIIEIYNEEEELFYQHDWRLRKKLNN